MQFDPGLQPGDILTFKALQRKFKCGNAGGILPSNTNKAIVIVSNHIKGIYSDRWEGDILHYTGAGQEWEYAKGMDVSSTNGQKFGSSRRRSR